MIKLVDVNFSFRDSNVLTDINLEVKDGQFVGIIGGNGAGKTTLIKLILGLLKPTSGFVHIHEKSISYVSQTTSLNDSNFPSTVEEAVGLGLVKMEPSFLGFRKRKALIEATLKEFNLFDIRKKLVGECSGGQIQKVKIAKAVISSPSLLVLDEPDAGMDEEGHDKMLELLTQLNKEKGITIIFISHHLHDLEDADCIYRVKNKKVEVFEGGDEHAAL